MIGKVYSVTLTGIEGTIVAVESDVSDGLPGFEIVGIPGSEVRESRERVRSSFRNCNYFFPPKKITINLSPADIRKKGCGFDLAIAISVLSAMGWFGEGIEETILNNSIFCGELGLDGSVSGVSGVLSSVICARANHFKRCFVPVGNAKEASCIEGIDIIGISCLPELVRMLQRPERIPEKTLPIHEFLNEDDSYDVDFEEVNGQFLARRAIEVAVSGMHNILFTGPPGSGKSMLAKRIPTIMPPLTYEESIELTRIYSITGMLENGAGLIHTRPFRAPHHTCTTSALIGGGLYPSPGEISLADRGLLFLDELPEFKRNVLESLRQPMEDRKVVVPRIHGKYEYPANTMIAAAMNPCKCGYYPDFTKCRCTPAEISRYRNRISGPLLDRIDISIEVLPLKGEELLGESRNTTVNESSARIRERVADAHEIQIKRFQDTGIFFNSQMTSKQTGAYCVMNDKASDYLKTCLKNGDISTRGFYKILKTARTIADMDHSDIITEKHIAESYFYRTVKVH